MEQLSFAFLGFEPIMVEPASSPEPVSTVSLTVNIERVVRALPESKPKPVWPSISIDVPSGEVSKFEANMAALRLLNTLEIDERDPSDDERGTLNRYSGWGGVSKVFSQTWGDWCARQDALREVLDPASYDSASNSVNNAHFTPQCVIEAMWAITQRLGFKGGRIIDPSAGVGYFLGAMPSEIAAVSTTTAVEIDTVSARFLAKLYAAYGVKVIAGGYEKAELPANFYDLAISNVPFGNYPVPDTSKAAYRNFLIHDYFFAKSLDLVRPGGLVMFVTSLGTLDKQSDVVRKYLASKARLLGVVRLPFTAFKQVANTEVSTDIVVLQKLHEGEQGNAPEWTEACQLPSTHRLNKDGVHGMYVNSWIKNHPACVIGKMVQRSNGYSASNAVAFDGDLATALQEKVSIMPEGVYFPMGTTVTATPKTRRREDLASYTKPGAFIVKEDGSVWAAEGSTMIEAGAKGKVADRIRALVPIRDAVRALVVAQVAHVDDAKLVAPRAELNAVYDAFVERFGYIHEKANRTAFKGDPDLPLLLSLEKYDEESGSAEKADLFYRRTVGATRAEIRCSTAEEALIASIDVAGQVNPGMMETLLGRPAEEIVAELSEKGAIYLDPETMTWETQDAYLSGNVRTKLAAARSAGPAFEINAVALEKIIPVDLGPSEIGARLGSSWIPEDVYASWVGELLDGDPTVKRENLTASWSVSSYGRHSVLATRTYGTDRVDAYTLIEQAMNQQVPTVKDDIGDGKYVVNTKETVAAREKQDDLKARFIAWLWTDEARSERLVRIYNDEFNSIVSRQYDGSHLTLPGFSKVYTLHQHQKDVIWRVVGGKSNTLMAHVVGAGKTLSMICSGMELKRIGIAQKPMFVVPNHMLEQFGAEFMRAYPGANILMAHKEDLQGERRRTLLSRIATGDWDGVLITHATFERIKLGDQYVERFVMDQLEEIALAMATTENQRDLSYKELKRQQKVWQARLEKLSTGKAKDDILSFDELGVDYLFVDEAHLFKNLWRFTKMTRVAGLPNSNAERSFDMFMKTRFIMAKHRGRAGVVFATGTPVSNSMAELWTMQRYLQPKTLTLHGVHAFDAWATNFGEVINAIELAPDGSGYRTNMRFARFVNIPDLMAMFREVADIRTSDMVRLPVPEAHRMTVAAKPTQDLKAFVITQVMSGDIALRTAEDLELAALSYAEVKALASGNPKVVEKAGIDAEVAKLTIVKSQWENAQWSNRREIASLPSKIAAMEDRLQRLVEDAEKAAAFITEPFKVTVKGKTFADRKELGKALELAHAEVRRLANSPSDTFAIGSIGEFKILGQVLSRSEGDVLVTLSGACDHEAPQAKAGHTMVMALERAIAEIPQRVLRHRDHLESMRSRLEALKVEIDRPFDKADRLGTLLQRQEELNRELGVFESVHSGLEEGAVEAQAA